MGKIFLIRHGQASLYSQNYDQLSRKGEEQARAIGEFFGKEGVAVHKVFMGTLQRHRQTYEHFVGGYGSAALPKAVILEGLDEHHGPKVVKRVVAATMEQDLPIGKPSKEKTKKYFSLYQQITERWAEDAVEAEYLEAVEPWHDFRARVKSVTDALFGQAEKGENVLLFTSGGPVAGIVGELIQLSDVETMRISHTIYNASISEIILSSNKLNHRPSLLTFNNIYHLGQELRTFV